MITEGNYQEKGIEVFLSTFYINKADYVQQCLIIT